MNINIHAKSKNMFARSHIYVVYTAVCIHSNVRYMYTECRCTFLQLDTAIEFSTSQPRESLRNYTLSYCTHAGIILEAYSPLINPGSQYKDSDAPNLLMDPVVKEIAGKHNATVGQVL